MKFIELHHAAEGEDKPRPMMVNLDLVKMVTPPQYSKGDGKGAKVTFTDGSTFGVTETYELVKGLLNGNVKGNKGPGFEQTPAEESKAGGL